MVADANLTIMNHPLIQHKITQIRDKTTDSWLFREIVHEITYLMLYESTRALKTRTVEIETPLAPATVEVLDEALTVVPILRAGLGMLDGFLSMVPHAKVGFIGLYRDHATLEPVEYYCKLPQLDGSLVVVLDPMLATGGSVTAALDMLKEKGAHRLQFLCILASPEGLRAVEETHPDVDIYCASVDEQLDEKGYILPGIGDCGDRLFFTS